MHAFIETITRVSCRSTDWRVHSPKSFKSFFVKWKLTLIQAIPEEDCWASLIMFVLHFKPNWGCLDYCLHLWKNNTLISDQEPCYFDVSMFLYTVPWPAMTLPHLKAHKTPSEVALDFLSCLEIQWNFRHCFLFPICQPLQQWKAVEFQSQRMTNRK